MRASPVLQPLCAALPLLPILSGIAGVTCSAKKSREPSAVERTIASSLREVLGVEVASLACPRPAGSGAGFACQGHLAGGSDFAVDVSAVDERGRPVWIPRGKLKFEYQIALGFADAVRVQPRRVRCPDDGAIDRGFDCEVELSDGSIVTVSVAAAPAGPTPREEGARGQAADTGGRFEWITRDVLMLGAIEERIERDLDLDPRLDGAGQADCGRSVQRITPGESFECSVELTSGERRTAVVSILDRDGHVQYRIEDSAE